MQISNAFKTAFGETDVNAVATDSRVRPVFEWQYGGGWSGALGFIQSVYGAQHPVNYYLYGGGGGWYADDSAGGFSDVSFANPAFANGLTGWSSSGSAGVVANGSSMGNPNAPPLFSAIAITNGATESGNTVTITTTAPLYFVAGQSVTVSGVTVGGYNGTFTITSVTPTTFTYVDSQTGLANSGDGIVTGNGSSTQTAYLQPGASISQNVTFSGGYADITLYATQTVPTNWYDGLTITLTPTNGGPAINNGQPIPESEGATFYSGSQNAFAWDRTEAFYTGASDYTYTVTFTSTLPSGTVFFDNVAIQTVNGMFNETTAALQSTNLNISGDIESDVNLAQEYGLNDVGYEGGFDFNQNQSGYMDINGYRDMGYRGYSSSVPNVGMYANLDPRTEQLAIDTFDQFYAAGGTLAVVFESAGNINSWAVAAPYYFDTNTPKLQAAASVEQTSQPATYGLKPGQSGTDNSWWLGPGNTLDSTYLVPLGAYSLTMTFEGASGNPAGQTDSVEVVVDGQLINTVKVPDQLGGTFTVSIGTLTAGQHSVELINTAPSANGPLSLGPPGTPIDTLKYTGPAKLPIILAQPSILWSAPGSIVYGTPLGSNQLDAIANVPGTFSYTPNTGAILGTGVDTLTVTFTPNNSIDYTMAAMTTTITIARATPTVSVAGGGPYDYSPLPATATVTGVVARVDAAPASSLEGVSPELTYYAGGTLLSGPPTTVGTYTVVASFPGSADYAPATAQASFTITPATPTINWADPANMVYGTPLSSAQLDAEASVLGSFTYSPAAGTVLGGGNGQTLKVIFTPTDSTDFSSATTTVTINVTSNVYPSLADLGFQSPYVGTGASAYQVGPLGTPWTYTGSAGLAGNSSAFTSGNPPAPAGTQVGVIQQTGRIRQTVNLAAGIYTVSFAAAQRGNFQSSSQTVGVLFDGTAIEWFTPSGTSYTTFTTSNITATAGAHTLTFVGLNPNGGDNTVFIDEVILGVANSAQVGGFETPNVGVGPSAYRIDPTGTAWTYTGQAGVAGNGSAFTSGNPSAPEGAQVGVIQQTGKISQTFSLAAGTYTVSFAAAQRGNFQSSSQTFEVLADSLVIGVFTPAGTRYSTLTTGPFTVNAGTHTLAFIGINPSGGDNTAFIDQVAVNQPALQNVAYMQDPDFASPSLGVGPSAYEPDPAGSPWTFTGTAGLAGDGSAFTAGNPSAPSGTQVAYIQMKGQISQKINLTAGTYDLTLSAAQRGNFQTSTETFQVVVDSTVVGIFSPSGSDYTILTTGPFTVTMGTHNLALVGLDPNGGDNTVFVDQLAINVIAPQAQPNIHDPDFESPGVGVGSNAYQLDPAGSPWTFTGSAGLAGDGSAFTAGNSLAPIGTQVAYIQEVGQISQSFTLAAGTYDLSLVAAQGGNIQTSSETFKVVVDGMVVGIFNPSGTAYTTFTTGPFTVASGTQTLEIVGLDPNGGDNTVLICQLVVNVATPPAQSSLKDADFESPGVDV